MSTRIFVLSALFFLIVSDVFAAPAKEFTIRRISSADITMGDSTGVIVFDIKRSKGNTEINKVRFQLPSDYKTLPSSFGPSYHWTVTVSPLSLGDNVIEFSVPDTETSLHIGNQAEPFTLVVQGSGEQALPRYAQDTQHTLMNVEAWGIGEVLDLNPPNDTLNHPWKLHGLSAKLFIDPLSVDKNAFSTFSVEIQNRTTTTKNVTPVTPSKVSGSGSGTFDYVSGPHVGSWSLAPNESFQFNYQYTGDTLGTVTYETGGNSGSTTTAIPSESEEAVIGPLGGWIEAPLEAGDNEEIPIRFHVINNTSSNITNIEPKRFRYQKKNGLNNPVYISGPVPEGPVPVLQAGAEFTFTWVYKVSGPPGAQYKFGAGADSDQGDTNKDQSSWGTIQMISSLLSPSTVSVGDSPVEFTFHFHNGGPVNSRVSQIKIFHPDSPMANHFINGSATGGYLNNWTTTEQSDGILFTSGIANYLLGDKGMDLKLSYQIPDATWYPNDTVRSFNVNLSGQIDIDPVNFSKTLPFDLTLKRIELEVIPSPPTSPANYWDADGSFSVQVRAKLFSGTNPLAGKNIYFSSMLLDPSANVIIPAQISPNLEATDSQGYAYSTLIAPRYEDSSPAYLGLKLVATYQNISTFVSPIYFKPYNLPSLQLVLLEVKTNGSYNAVENTSLMPGDNAQFKPFVVIIGSQSINIKKQTSYGISSFTFNDQSNNGSSVYTAPLSQDYNDLSPSVSHALICSTSTVPSGMLYGHYTATATLFYTNSSGVAAPNPLVVSSNPSNDVRIGSLEEGIQIINWRETLSDFN